MQRRSRSTKNENIFGRELIAAGRELVGEPAVMHHHLVSGCRQATKVPPECWEIGLGNPGYDCSGFIITVISRVLGVSVDAWPRNQRHVRDWWSGESSLFNSHPLSEDAIQRIQPGDIVVERREYETDDGVIVMPGHVSIVTKSGAIDSPLPHILSANTLLRESIREVIERPKLQLADIMGSLTLRSETFASLNPDDASVPPALQAGHDLQKSVN